MNHGVSASYGRDLEAATHSLLGLSALAATLAEQGVAATELFAGSGIDPAALADPQARMSHRQKIIVFANARRLTRDPAIGLIAGQRQRLSDFGVFGYAMASSATFGEAVALGMKHLRLAGPVLEKRFRVDGDVAVFSGHDVIALGELLPLATEFWFSSVHALIGRALEQPFVSREMQLPYAAPAHAAAYGQVFGCPVRFGSEVMEWRFDAALLSQPCPNANPITADLCASFCARMLESLDQAATPEPELVCAIKRNCLDNGDFPTADAMAARLGVSTRTLHRRLAEIGSSYQDILDGIRRRLALEYLQHTPLSVEEIAVLTGFSDASNFRKAFRKWTGAAPSHYRQGAI